VPLYAWARVDGYEFKGKKIISLGNLLCAWAPKDDELFYWHGKNRWVTISWWEEFERTNYERLRARQREIVGHGKGYHGCELR
jgi:hypothetical protein